MYKIDYHIHSEFSGDSVEKIEDIIKKSIEIGLKEIAITDHLEVDVLGLTPEWEINLEKRRKHMLDLISKYKDKIIIRQGIEVGVQPHLKNYLEAVIEKYDFDFVIASNHSLYKIDIASGILQKNKSKKEIQKLYFKSVLKNIKVYEKFNVFGHLDYVTRYGGDKFKGIEIEDNWELIVEILEMLISKGKGLEINTSGYKYGENRNYPQIEILKKYFELGGRIITVGSDAHEISHISRDIEKAYEVLEKLNIEFITTFEKMKPVFKKIYK